MRLPSNLDDLLSGSGDASRSIASMHFLGSMPHRWAIPGAAAPTHPYQPGGTTNPDGESERISLASMGLVVSHREAIRSMVMNTSRASLSGQIDEFSMLQSSFTKDMASRYHGVSPCQAFSCAS